MAYSHLYASIPYLLHSPSIILTMAQQRERRLINEYLMTFRPSDVRWVNVRLGPVANPEEARMYSVLQRWIDCILYDGTTITLLEAKIRPDFGVVGQIEAYDSLFSQTPEFQHYWEKPRKLAVLSAYNDVNVRTTCEEKGIEFILFTPEWVKPYLAERYRGQEQ